MNELPPAMRPSPPAYRLGLAIIASTALASLGLCLALVNPHPARRSAEDVSAAGRIVGPFAVTERSGRAVDAADLADRPWIAAFVFTNCPLSCPKISSTMRRVQGRLEGSGVRLVTITVDPERDSPEVLAHYADHFEAGPDWWFLTGPEATIDRINAQMMLTRSRTPAEAVRAGAEEFTHESRLVLVDRGNRIQGYYDSTDPARVSALVSNAWRRGRGPIAQLPAINASLNLLTSLLLVVAWMLVRSGRRVAHAVTMVAALTVSAVFLGCYLTYHALVGSMPYTGIGAVRYGYYTILLSHVVLAAAALPLIVWTVARAIRRRFALHRRLAGVTFPVWLYVSITGVVVYVMLYGLPRFGQAG